MWLGKMWTKVSYSMLKQAQAEQWRDTETCAVCVTIQCYLVLVKPSYCTFTSNNGWNFTAGINQNRTKNWTLSVCALARRLNENLEKVAWVPLVSVVQETAIALHSTLSQDGTATQMLPKLGLGSQYTGATWGCGMVPKDDTFHCSLCSPKWGNESMHCTLHTSRNTNMNNNIAKMQWIFQAVCVKKRTWHYC